MKKSKTFYTVSVSFVGFAVAVIAILLFSHNGNGMGGYEMNDKTNYNPLWEKVDDFTRDGLPKSALEVVEKIYAMAKKNENAGQLIKALIHKAKYLQEVEEEAFYKVLKEMSDELKENRFPVTPLLHSMLAEQYWNYLSQNQYRISQRTQTSADFKEEDLRTWSLPKLVETVVDHYAKSLENPEEAKKTAVDVFDEVIQKGNVPRKYRPTLYDFLTHRAVDFYMDSRSGLTQPKYQFTLNNPDYLSDMEKFAQLEFKTLDPLSFEFYALKYLQDLIKFHIQDNNTEALLDADLKRLRFVYSNGVIPNKEIIYETLLTGMMEKFNQNPLAAEIALELAKLYKDLGDKFVPGAAEKYKWHKKKAIDLCNQTIEKYPKTLGAQNCKSLIADITEKKMILKTERAAIIKKPLKTLLYYQNLDTIFLKIIPTNRDEFSEQRQNRYEDLVNFFSRKKAAKEWNLKLPNDGDYQLHSVEIKIDPLDLGDYILMTADSPNFDYKNHAVSYSFFTVSNIAYISRLQGKNGWEFYLMDRDSGQPLANVQAQTWYAVYDNAQRRYVNEKGKLFTTDAKGYLNIKYGMIKNNYFSLEFIAGSDHLFLEQNFNLYSPYEYETRKIRTVFFTDRAIYRPGQTLYFKGIILETDSADGTKNRILPRQSTTVSLFDVNNQKTADLNLVTNDYGTFSGTFQLPMGRLNGNMHIADSYGDIYFSVEEYKRPKFEVTFQPLDKTYRINDKVIVKGEAKAYAGYPIDNAEVKFRVVRNVFYPYPWYYYYRYGGFSHGTPEMEIANGVISTDASGVFEVNFDAIPDLTLSEEDRAAFRFTVYADVTDINGETQSSQKDVYIGSTALILSINIPNQLDKDNPQPKIPINSTNLSGEFAKAEGLIAIYKLKEPDRIFRPRLWETPDKYLIDEKDYHQSFPYDAYKNEDQVQNREKEKKIFQQPFDTGTSKEMNLNGVNQWPTGSYVVEMTAKDRFGNEIKDIKYFTLFSSKGTQSPQKSLAWFTLLNNNLEPGQKAVILVASAEKNTRLIFEVEHNGSIVDTQFITLNNEQKRIEIPILEKHRGNLGVLLTFVSHNRMMPFNSFIYVPWSNKKLDISFETFRNKLMPGEKEEWRLKIKGPGSEKYAAEMVAALYDASLDAFRANYWSFDIYPYRYLSYYWENNSFFSVIGSFIVGKLRDYAEFGYKTYDMLMWFDFYPIMPEYRQKRMARPGAVGGVAREEAAPQADYAASAPPTPAPMSLKEEVTVLGAVEGKSNAKANGGKNGDQPPKEPAAADKNAEPVKARTNFNETAFFFPHLKTDANGEIIISFTIPEALTRWKMLGFAHTKKLEYGFTQNELITQKDLMVVPNTPRFFREGDTLIYTAKITNLSDNELQGTAQLQLFDAVTMQPVDIQFKNKELQKSFTAKKGQSALVGWSLEIPAGLDAVTYRVTARSGKFSDGEEQAVPILTNRMLVTESLPLPVRSSQTKTFTFDKLIASSKSATLRHKNLTLEFTSNPVWYAVQALPYLMEYPHECMEQVFSRYYANSMASYIANSNPKIKRVFDSWRENKNGSSNALLSNLEKNQELKSVLIEETPWVLNGQDETQRKARIALLFELNLMASQLEQALAKLEEGQLPSGGWPWFKGMFESRYITQHIVCGFAHLQTLHIIDIQKNNRIRQMIAKAIPYLDSQLTEDYKNLIKYNVKLNQNNIGHIQVHYFYARSHFQEIPLDDRDTKAFDYYQKQIKTYWVDFKNDKYIQGLMALVMKRYDDMKTATAIMQSIKEHAIYSEEMGMYWKNPNQYWFFWYQAPIETQAILIEAFSEVLNDEKSVDEMKTWLLKQKQTQDWRNTKATVEAIYALLLRGEDWLAENQPPQITIGKNNPITITPGKMTGDSEIIKAEAGTGYFKTSWSSTDIKPDMGNVTVVNNNKVAAWGSLYWQYFENLDKITPAKTPLSIVKKLFVQKSSDTGPILNPIDSSTKLKIGDRVKVRIEIRVDRDMEYVHMKDMRASCLEPEEVISRYHWQDGLGYYQTTKDASTNFFFDYLRKGTYVFEYGLKVTHEGDFSNGITSIQCMYAPEFTSHSEGIRIKTTNK